MCQQRSDRTMCRHVCFLSINAGGRYMPVNTRNGIEHYFSVSRSALLYRLQNIGLITESTRSQLAEIKVKYSAKCFGYDTALYEPANEGLVIGDFGEKARKLFEQEKISEGHYIELLHKININGTQENEDSTLC